MIAVMHQAVRIGARRLAAPDARTLDVECLDLPEPTSAAAEDASTPGPGAIHHHFARATSLCGSGPAGEGARRAIAPREHAAANRSPGDTSGYRWSHLWVIAAAALRIIR